jgi:pilus assembly protein Flp/PilA
MMRKALVQPAEKGTMKTYMSRVVKFLVSEDGPTAVEYAVMLALIVVVCLAAIGTIGTNANNTFNSVASSLGTGS